MCMQDYAIGLSIWSTEIKTTVQVTSGILLPANPNRAFILISHPETNPIFVSTIDPATTTSGLHLGTTDQPLKLDVWTYGNLVQRAWYAIASGGAATLSIWTGEFDLQRAKEFIRKLGA